MSQSTLHEVKMHIYFLQNHAIASTIAKYACLQLSCECESRLTIKEHLQILGSLSTLKIGALVD